MNCGYCLMDHQEIVKLGPLKQPAHRGSTLKIQVCPCCHARYDRHKKPVRYPSHHHPGRARKAP